MDNNAFKTIPLETALEYHAYAADRGRRAGAQAERARIEQLLKAKGHHAALVAIKMADDKK